MRCSSPDDLLDVTDKERELAAAVVDNDFEKVHSLLLSGVNRNGLWKGKTLLAVAASTGDVNTMRVLVETEVPAKSTAPQPSFNSGWIHIIIQLHHVYLHGKYVLEILYVHVYDVMQGKNGYFVVVRESEDEEKKQSRYRCQSENISTPEGMENLEWDAEVEDVSPSKEQEEDVWSSQYKWYARILANTSQIRNTEADTKNGNRVDAQDPRGRSALHYAAEAGRFEAVQYLVESGCKVDLGDRESLTPLHLASVNGHLEVVTYLLRKKASVNAKCTDKMTPLHYASSRGRVDIVTALIAFNANVNSMDSGDRTPLKLAASRDLYQVVKVLVESGAKVNIEDVKGYTSLCEAVWQKNVAMARLLLEYGAKLTPTPFLLHYAILHRHAEMVELLLTAGAMANIRDDHGSTPLIVAAITAQPTIIRLLLEYGAQVDFFGGLSWKTPLISVLQTDNIPTDLGVILELILGGADVDKACWDITPLVAAMRHHKVDAAVLLLRHGASISTHSNKISHDPLIVPRRIGALLAAQAIVMCGYDLWKNCPEITPCVLNDHVDFTNVECWLKIQKFTPLKLSELTRIKIRSLWPRQNCMADYVRSLGLPRLIEEYLMFSDIPVDRSEFRGSANNPNFSIYWGFRQLKVNN